ncbi:DUF4255 domain-containing protein [Streptomyces sp. NBC_01373]|uniref:DUF4255 domain-containing protein n=1 Tax=Streptomyces sp. NBC_01373 TaxID=2903843 RepID=UPI00224EC9EF|nr:DUF4255 domain-containing protein [Streptomyces sp. NBC_01373]MCX4702064.1 DUF4255 domain-containing protein [Streptomyces sp. NBC_01373]
MSNALAIAHVTQALALLIENNVGPEFGEAVKVEPRKPPADAQAEPTISVFLYQVTPNTSQRNNDLPTRASDGTLVKRPAAALDLHYLISAYGEETELVGQRLIGSVVRTLHETPILPKDVVERAGERPYLAGSDLAEAAQRVRFTPTVMDIDETSKLWGMLHQTPYSLSVVYQAALVFIDGRETPVPAKPVERSDVRVVPFVAPVPETETEDPVSRPAPASESAPAPASPSAKQAAKAPAKTAAKTVAKAPAARTRKAAQAGKSAQPEPRKRTARRADGEGTEN